MTPNRENSSFSSSLFKSLLAAMTEGCESSWRLAPVQDSDSVPDESEPLRINLTLYGSLRGEILLEFRRAEVAVLASKLLRTPASEFSAEHADALLKLVTAGVTAFCPAALPEYGTFTIKAAVASEPPPNPADPVRTAAANEEAARVSVAMHFNPVLTQALTARSQAVNKVAGVDASDKLPETTAAPEPVNLDLVMNVELNVTLRFGQRQLTLREVLELTSGSVVELDRQVEEPVELLLNGMVIARGEAVVVDGNYGLRVTEVTQHVSSLVLG